MRIEEAIRIIDVFSRSLRMKDGVNEGSILELAKVMKEFELEKEFPAIRNLYRRFERNQRDRVVGDALVRRMGKVFEFYLLEDNSPFIPHPANGEVDGEIRIAECTSGGYFGRERIEYCQHEAISGRSGSGKTTIQLHTFEAMNKIGVKCIVISSVKRSFRKLVRRFPNTLVIRCGAPDDHFKFNPFQLPEGANINQGKAVFTRCLSESEQVYIGTENYISSNLADLFEQQDNPTFHELLLKIKNDKPNYKEPRKISYKDSALGRLTSIKNSMGNMFDCKKGYPLLEILRHNNIILEEDSLNPSEKQLINSLFLTWLFLALTCQNFSITELRYFVIIDEGHDVVNHRFGQISNPMILTFLQVVREAGIGVSIGCQNPAYIDGRVFGNTYTKILMNLADGIDIKRCIDSMGFRSKDEVQEIYRLKVGEAIVRMARYPRLFKIKTEPYDLDASVSDSEIIKNNERILRDYSYEAQVSFYNAREDVVSDKEKSNQEENKQNNQNAILEISADEKRFLMDVYNRPYSLISGRCESLGLSGSVRKRIIKSLIEKDLVIELPIKTGQGRGKTGKILVLSDKAESAIEPAQRMKYGRSANLHHSFIQQILKSHFQNVYRAKADVELMRNGKSVDIAITKNDGSAVAVEYERTSLHARENIEKDLAAGFEKVITVCGKNQVLEEIKKIVDKELFRGKERISICLLKDVLAGAIEI